MRRKTLMAIGLLVVLALLGGSLLTIVTTPIVDSGPFSSFQANLPTTPLTEPTRICERFRLTDTTGTGVIKLFSLKNVELPLGKYLQSGVIPVTSHIELYEVPNEKTDIPPTQGTLLFTYTIPVTTLPMLTLTNHQARYIEATGANWQAFDTNDVTLKTSLWYWLCVKSPSASSGDGQYGVGWPMDSDNTYSILVPGVAVVDIGAYKWFRDSVNSFTIFTRSKDYSQMSMKLMGSEQTTPTVPQLQVSIVVVSVSGKTASFSSTVSGGQTPYTYAWSFGDGGTSSQANPSHTYTSEDTYSVSLTVTDSQASPSQITKSLQVCVCPLTADFTSSVPTNSRRATFDGTPTGGATPYTYAWDFGDDKTATVQDPTHTYEVDGTYLVQFVVTDRNGATATVEKSINIAGPPPKMNVGIDLTDQTALKITVKAIVTGGTGSYSSYAWTFGDGNVGTGSQVQHTYPANGTYNVALTVQDSAGNSGTGSRDVTVSTVPICDPCGADVSIDFSFTVDGFVASFSPTTTGGDGDYSYSWIFGDDETSTSDGPAHPYKKAGIYSVMVTVTDSTGHTDTTTKDVTIAAEPFVFSIPGLILLIGGIAAIIVGTILSKVRRWILISAGLVLLILSFVFFLGVL